MKQRRFKTICLFLFTLNIYACSFGNTLTSSELTKAGYMGIIFGDQNTRGISIYQFGNNKIRNIIIGDTNVEYAYPVFSGGRFFCIRKTAVKGSVECDVIESSIGGEFTPIKATRFSNIYSLSISNNGSKLCMLAMSNNKLELTIINLQNNIILANISVDVADAETTKLVWDRDDNIIYVVEKTNFGKKYDIKSRQIQEVSTLPVYCNSKACISASDNEYLIDGDYPKVKKVSIDKKTAHSISLSTDGKLFIYGWLRGSGFETFCITDIINGANLTLNIKHSGTALGLQLI